MSDFFCTKLDIYSLLVDAKGNIYHFYKTLYNGSDVTNKFVKIEDGGVIKVGNEEFIVGAN